MLKVTPVFAALLTIFFLFLTRRVIRLRRLHEVPLGHGGFSALERAIAAHANFVEYTPLALLLLGFLETNHAPAIALWALGAIFLTGRLMHAYGVSRTQEDFRWRVGGMVGTLAILGVLAAANLFFALR